MLSGNETSAHHKHSGLQQWWGAAAPLLALLVWVACSSMVIILNRQLLVEDKFRFPMTLTAMGQGASYLGGEQGAALLGAGSLPEAFECFLSAGWSSAAWHELDASQLSRLQTICCRRHRAAGQ